MAVQEDQIVHIVSKSALLTRRGILAMARLQVYRDWENSRVTTHGLPFRFDIASPAHNAGGYFAHVDDIHSTAEAWKKYWPEVEEMMEAHRDEWENELDEWEKTNE